VSVLDCDSADWREPTFEEQAESELWCDRCGRPASRCTVTTVLALHNCWRNEDGTYEEGGTFQ
jgi:hypothetical protein